MHRTLHALLTVALLSTLPACVSLSTAAPEKTRYVLNAPRPGATQQARPDTALEVRATHSARESRTHLFVYVTAANRMEVDYYHEFAVMPTVLVRDQTHRWLLASGLWDHVIDGASRLAPTHLLESTIHQLHADYWNPEKPRAVMEIEFRLLRPSGGDYESLLDETYSRTLLVGDDSADALVAAWSRALGEILGDLEKDMAAVLAE